MNRYIAPCILALMTTVGCTGDRTIQSTEQTDAQSCTEGHEACPCSEANACLSGLTCLSGICVDPNRESDVVDDTMVSGDADTFSPPEDTSMPDTSVPYVQADTTEPDTTPEVVTCYTVSGTVTGLRGTLDLIDSHGESLQLIEDGIFTLDGCYEDLSTFAVNVSSAPSIQRCVATNASGTIEGADITNVSIACDTHMLFKGDDGTHGDELWVVYGLTNLNMVADVGPGANNGLGPWDMKHEAVNNVFIFTANDGQHGYELWKTDLTNTEMIRDLVPGPGDSFWLELVHFKNHVYYVRAPGADTVLGRTDGTSEGTLDGIAANISGGFGLTEYQDKLYFRADHPGAGNELTSYDGTVLELIKDINPIGDSSPSNFFEFNGKLYFSADAGFGSELWVTDGTEPGTVRVHQLNPNNDDPADPRGFAELNGELFFFANDGMNGRELWKTDGTELGTRLVLDINPGPQDGIYFGDSLQVANNKLMFAADDGVHGKELWVSDGTTNGTFMLRDINTNTGALGGSDPREFFVVGNTLYFQATDPTRRLWESDGTTNGTQLSFEFFEPNNSSAPRYVGEAHGAHYVRASTPNRGTELWEFKNDRFQPVNDVCPGFCSGL